MPRAGLTVRIAFGYTGGGVSHSKEAEMKRVVVTAIVICVALALTAPATVGLSPLERKQQAQIRQLQKQVKVLKKQVANAENLAIGGILVALCTNAATADALQGTWKIEDPTGTKYGVQQPINDNGIGCKQLQINRAPNQATVAVFQQIANVFK
jgi:hypothetical protein